MSRSWQYDAPSGTYKNHTLSSELRAAAIEQTKFMQFVKPEPGYGKKKGESITITRLADISVPSDASLTEGQRVPEDDITLSTVSVTVGEKGRSIPYSSLEEDLGKFDLNSMVQKKLRDQMARSLDIEAATAFKSGQVKAIPDGASSLTFDTDGTASTTATVNLGYYHVERIRDYMFDDLLIPMIGDSYMCIASTKALRGLKDDTAFETWNQYTTPEMKAKSEVGRIEEIRFVESNHRSALSASLGAGGVLGEAVFFGDDAVVMAVAEDPSLRAGLPDDYGRRLGVAWYGIYAFLQTWGDSANAGEAKVVHVTSA